MLAAACIAAAGCAVRLENQIRYAGALGSCGDGTGRTAQATLVRVADNFSFTPQDGVLIISGPIAADDTFSGSLAPTASRRDGSAGSNSEPPPALLSVEGRLDDEVATGTYVGPRCRTEFRLPESGRTWPSEIP